MQSTSTHISDHIHEWMWRRRLKKAPILDQLLEDWFTKSLLPPIVRDVAMGGTVTKEQVIDRAQYFDLVYSQFETLYDLIPHAPRLSHDLSKPTSGAHANGMVGSIKLQCVTQSTGKQVHIASTPASS
jgi:hypothetical protein